MSKTCDGLAGNKWSGDWTSLEPHFHRTKLARKSSYECSYVKCSEFPLLFFCLCFVDRKGSRQIPDIVPTQNCFANKQETFTNELLWGFQGPDCLGEGKKARKINAGFVPCSAKPPAAFVAEILSYQGKKIGWHLVGVWIGGVWNGHFPESKIFSEAEFFRKIPEILQRVRFLRARRNPIPYPQPFHTPTGLTPRKSTET